MKGHMRQRGASWELKVYLGIDAVTGKQRYTYRTVTCGKREAQRLLGEMVSEVERGFSVRTSSTVGELLEAWLELASRDFSPKTVKETRGFVDRNLMPTFRERRPGIGLPVTFRPISLTALSSASCRRPEMKTYAPSSTNNFAPASAIPDVAPVITAALARIFAGAHLDVTIANTRQSNSGASTRAAASSRPGTHSHFDP